MFRSAADPRSPLNPFHAESASIRREGEQLFAEVLRGSTTKVPQDVAARLPGLLWTYSMGIVLYWIHDASPGRQRTRRLVEHTVELVVGFVKLAGNPLLGTMRRRVFALLDDLAFGAPHTGP
jgi:hypothetical protein